MLKWGSLFLLIVALLVSWTFVYLVFRQIMVKPERPVPVFQMIPDNEERDCTAQEFIETGCKG